ncbi:MAG TPA: amylo-alpha-1,6-glucosidase [Thermosynechococcaceae cyanobacterium]
MELDTREWLLTNRFGSFASGTVSDARTRTYHGWLIAALEPPDRRTLLLSHLEASLEIAGQVFALGTNIWTARKIEPVGYEWLRSFTIDPDPLWVWAGEGWQLTRRIAMPRDGAAPIPVAAVEVEYVYEGEQTAMLQLRPLITDRDFHHPQQQKPHLSFSQVIGSHQLLLQAKEGDRLGTPWSLHWSQGTYHPEGVWYWGYFYPEEAQRGLDCQEDFYSPGYLSVAMQSSDRLQLKAQVGFPVSLPTFPAVFSPSRPATLRDPFLVLSSTAPKILAGYHWYSDRSRDTLLCLPGFALTQGEFALAWRLLDRLGQHCVQGLLPNELPRVGEAPVLQSIDCSLWWIETLGLYLEASQDWDFLKQQYAVVKQIYKSFTAGTLHSIRVDASDGLVTWDDGSVALTWMDAIVEGQPVTPRNGKPIEINALWYSALCWGSQWAARLAEEPDAPNRDRLQSQAKRYTDEAFRVRRSLQKFWNPNQGYLFDRIEPDDRLDSAIRPNAVLALSLHHCGFSKEQAQTILQTARDRLLTPYGLRSLDSADPAYRGRYEGDLRQRDLSVHQGTIWSGLLGPFLRSWERFYGATAPIDLQPLRTHFSQEAGLGGISELFDGDAPHTPRGAIAHALPIAELLRLAHSL